MLVNTMVKELEEVKKSIDECFEDYSYVLSSGDNEMLSILSVYLKIKHRDNMSFNADNNGLRTRMFNLAKTSVDILNSQYGLNIDLTEMNKYLGKIHNDNKNKGNEHYINVNETIDNTINELRKTISNNRADNTIVDSVLAEFSTGIVRDVKDLVNILNQGLNASFSLYDYSKTLIDYNVKKPINQKTAFMITDAVGNRDENIGAYIGITHDNKFFAIPQGAGYINKTFNKYYTSGARYFNTFSDAAQFVAVHVRDFYRLKYNK